MPSSINLTGWNKIRARVRAVAAQDAKVKVGVLASAGVHPDSEIKMVELAAIHEFGSPAAHIPERSFIRRTLELRREDITKMVTRTTESYLKAKVELAQALGLIGLFVSTAIKATITSEQVVPRLAETEAGRRTIERKGSHVTLVDHAELLNSISWEIKGEGGGEGGDESEGGET